MKEYIRSELRGPTLFGKVGCITFMGLVENQPMILEREPSNPVDPCAIIVRTLLGQPAGYVARETAAYVAQGMDLGTEWLCKVTGNPPSRGRAVIPIMLWLDGEPEKQHEELDGIIPECYA